MVSTVLGGGCFLFLLSWEGGVSNERGTPVGFFEKPRLDVIRKEALSFYRTISGVRLCWKLEEPKGPKGLQQASHRMHACDNLCFGFGV